MAGHHPTNKLIGREPIPHQNNQNRSNLSKPTHASRPEHPVLATLSSGYPEVRGRLLTCYSPVRHSSTPTKVGAFPFDLHVLSTTPAFVLSQDQTLQKNQKNKPHTNPNNQKSHQDQHAAHSNSPENQSRPKSIQTTHPTPLSQPQHPPTNTARRHHNQPKETRQAKNQKQNKNGTKNKHTIEISNNTPTKEAPAGLKSQPTHLSRHRKILSRSGFSGQASEPVTLVARPLSLSVVFHHGSATFSGRCRPQNRSSSWQRGGC